MKVLESPVIDNVICSRSVTAVSFPKPFIVLGPEHNLKQYKYIHALVQEMHLKVELGFINAIECGFTSVYCYRAGNVIIGSCNEYTRDPDTENDLDMEPRLLGLAMVPGHHIARMWVDNVKEENGGS